MFPFGSLSGFRKIFNDEIEEIEKGDSGKEPRSIFRGETMCKRRNYLARKNR
jgi:hypothetical protein